MAGVRLSKIGYYRSDNIYYLRLSGLKRLTFDAKGNLYGTTGGGGDHNWSTRADGRGRPPSISDPTYFRAGT
jgi:hypothetical protein